MIVTLSHTFTSDEVTAALAEWVMRKRDMAGPYKATSSANLTVVDGQARLAKDVVHSVRVEVEKRDITTMGEKGWDARYCCDPTCGYQTPTHRTTNKCRPSTAGIGAPVCTQHSCPYCEPLRT